MKIKLILTGKTEKAYIAAGMSEYCKRLIRYIPFEISEIEIKKPGGKDIAAFVKTESAAQLKHLEANDYVVLLDEKGKSADSVAFSGFLQQKMNESRKSVVFIIGGAYGFSPEIYKRADYMLSLSSMTFSHQLARLIFIEQLYRAFTIINGEPYHHQ